MEQSKPSADHFHKRPNYLIVFIVLAVLTAIELGITQAVGGGIRTPLLLALMLAKVVLVALYYMHLQSESRWFAAFILAPIPFIVLIVSAFMIRTLH